jgi:hypothetical protein
LKKTQQPRASTSGSPTDVSSGLPTRPYLIYQLSPQQYVDISMPDYDPAALHKFRHDTPTSREDAPHKWINPLTAPKYNMHLILTPVLRSTNPK